VQQAVQGQDVTAQFTDLEARLRALKSSRAVFETLMSRARSIGEVIQVQQQITGVQQQIEQIEGQLKSLGDRSSFATLEVTIGEEGDPITRATATEDDGRFVTAWKAAVDNFNGGLAALIEFSGILLLALLGGVALFLAGRTAWRVARPPLV
jgi:hypothetical protein